MASKKNKSGGILLLLLLIIIGYFWLTDDDQENKLTGNWQLAGYEIKFNDNGSYKESFRLNMNETPQLFYGNFSVDLSQNPAWITIIPRKNENYPANYPVSVFAGYAVKDIARGLIRFISDNEIEVVFKTTKHNFISSVILMDQRPPSFKYNNENQLIKFTLTRIP